MSTTIVEVDSFDTSVQVPVDGDPRNAASVTVGFQSLTNRTKFMRKGIPGVAASLEVEVPIQKLTGPAGSGSWDYFSVYLDGAQYTWLTQTDVTGSKIFRSRVYLPAFSGYRITAIRARVQGNSGAATHAGIPANKPWLRLISLTPNGPSPAVTTHVACTESYANVAAYNSPHDIQTIATGGLPITPVLTNQYFLEFQGESGANSVAAALTVMGLYVTLAPP